MWDFLYSNPFTAIAAGFYSLLDRQQQTPFAPVDQFYVNNPNEVPQFGGFTDPADVVASGIFTEYQGGSSEAIPRSYDLPPLPNIPPSQTFPAPPTGSGSSDVGPLPLPAGVLPYGLGGSSGLGALRPSQQQTPEEMRRLYRMLPKGKKGDPGARALEKALGVAPKKRKVTYAKVGAKVARNLTLDVLKKIEMPAILRSITAGAGVRILGAGARVLGPLGAAVGVGSLLPDGTMKAVGDAVLNAFGRPGGQQQAKALAAKKKTDQLQPINLGTPDYRGTPGQIAAATKAAEEVRRGIRSPIMKIPKYAAPPKPKGLARLLSPSPKTLRNVKALGAAIDAYRKKQKTTAAAVASVAAATLPVPQNVPLAMSSYGSLPWAPTRTSTSCSCGPKKKRGPARKCLERSAVIYKAGRYKGKAAGTKCIRYAT